MNSNKFSPLNEPLDTHFGAEKGQKSVKSSKMAAQGQWFDLEMILIHYISGSYSSYEFSINSNKFSPLNIPLDLHFRPQKGQKSVKSSKMAAQGQLFGLGTILIDYISGSYFS